MEGLLIKLMDLIHYFFLLSLFLQSQTVYSDFQSSQSTQKWIQIKMHCLYVRSSIGEARVLGRKTINLLACIQKSMSGRVEVQIRWACSHIPAIARYGYAQPLSNLMMGMLSELFFEYDHNWFFLARLWECQVTASDFTTQDALTSQPVRLVVRGKNTCI